MAKSKEVVPVAAKNVNKCSCKSEFQDKRYGNNQRLHTPGVSKRTCTVCGTVTKI